MSWREAGDVAFYACTVVTVAFAILYFLSAPWWTTTTGRNIMAVMGSVALAFGYFTWVIWIGGVPGGFYPMRALIFALIALAIGWRLLILIKHQVIPVLRRVSRDRRGDRTNVEEQR